MRVEDEVGDRQLAEGVAQGRAVAFEPASPAGLGREQRREDDYGQSATSTERIGGSWLAASIQRPSRGSTKTEPLCVPR